MHQLVMYLPEVYTTEVQGTVLRQHIGVSIPLAANASSEESWNLIHAPYDIFDDENTVEVLHVVPEHDGYFHIGSIDIYEDGTVESACSCGATVEWEGDGMVVSHEEFRPTLTIVK